MKPEAPKNIFISMGTPFTADQSGFQDALLNLIQESELVPRLINKTDYPTGNPLVKIRSVLAECDAAIIVAYERTFFKEGIEKRLSTTTRKDIEDARYTTPWNQIEAAMAFALGIPIFVLMETELHAEGLLEEKYDWYIDRVEITGAAIVGGECRKRLSQFFREIRESQGQRAVVKRIQPDATIGEVISSLPVKVVWQILGATFVVISGVASAVAWLAHQATK